MNDEKRVFETGAVRDSANGKGTFSVVDISCLDVLGGVFPYISACVKLLKQGDLAGARIRLDSALEDIVATENYSAFLELGKVAQKGMEKYGKNNWQKGIPFSAYIDSTLRHWLKYLSGWKDENHLGSTLWNIMALRWTIEHFPNLNDYFEGEPKDDVNRAFSGEWA